MPRSPDAIVVGGGVAGLAAATALVEAGATTLVLEARGALGGRTSSFRDRETGLLVDNGQHVVLGCYRETFAYLQRIGSGDGIGLQHSLELPVVDRVGRRTMLRCPPIASPWHVLLGLIRWDALGWRDRLAAVRLAPELLRARRVAAGQSALPASSASQTVAQWLTAHGQTSRLNELLWEPLAVSALNQSIDTAAAAPFIRVLGGAFGPDPRDAAIGLPVKPLADVFAEPARAYLERRGSQVRMHAPARLALDAGRVSGVTVRGERMNAPAVVCAVPWFGLRTLVPHVEGEARLADTRKRALAMSPSPIVTVNCWFDRPVVEAAFVGLPGRVFQWAFERAVPDSAERWRGVHVSLVCSGADAIARAPDDAVVARGLAELRAALPRAAGATLHHAFVLRERHATFSLAPGQPPRPPTDIGVGGLFLAGDWTDTGLPATIEGAVVSGHRAAQAVLGSAASSREGA